MRFIEVSEYSEQQFMRLTGVRHSVFEMMIEVVSQSERAFGHPRKLSVEDQVLLTLSHWREYHSQFQLPRGRPRAVSGSAKRGCVALSQEGRECPLEG